MVEKIVVFEPTDDECGLEIVYDGVEVRLDDTFTPEVKNIYREMGNQDRLINRGYIIAKRDIPFIIRGLQEFVV